MLYAAPAFSMFFGWLFRNVSAQELSVILLTIAGIVIQLLVKFAPWIPAWYEKRSNKGLVMLGLIIVIGFAYIGAACTPFAAQLGIRLTCDASAPVTLLQAIFIIAIGQSLTFLYTRSTPSFKYPN